jgi:hypothetical protein
VRVRIVGAPGKLGTYMVGHALERGYEVVAGCHGVLVVLVSRYTWKREALVNGGGRLARLARFADLDDQVEAMRRVFAPVHGPGAPGRRSGARGARDRRQPEPFGARARLKDPRGLVLLARPRLTGDVARVRHRGGDGCGPIRGGVRVRLEAESEELLDARRLERAVARWAGGQKRRGDGGEAKPAAGAGQVGHGRPFR